MGDTLSFIDILMIIKKRLKMILLVIGLVVTTGILITTFLLTPIYQASTLLLVNQSKNETELYSSGEIRTNIELINTYSVIILAPRILDNVIEDLSLNQTHRELREYINVKSEQDSQVVSIAVEHEDPVAAMEIANATASVFQREIVDIMHIDNVSVISEAEIEPYPVRPSLAANIALAFVIGLLLSLGIAFLREYVDRSIKTEEDVEKTLGTILLGSVVVIDKNDVVPMENDLSISRLKRYKKGGKVIGS